MKLAAASYLTAKKEAAAIIVIKRQTANFTKVKCYSNKVRKLLKN